MNPYERTLQQYESDIRGHIKVSFARNFNFDRYLKLEHEMKIHMDYLEGKIEQMQAREL